MCMVHFLYVCIFVWLGVSMNGGIYMSDSAFQAALLALGEKRQHQTGSCVGLLVIAGWDVLFQAHQFSHGFTLDTSWRALGRHNVSCQCHKRRGKCASSYRKVVWQPPVLIKNALTLNAPINLSMLYLARVALCTVYKTQQLKQVLLASSKPSQAQWARNVKNISSSQSPMRGRARM